MDNNIGEARRSYALQHGKFTQEDAARFFGVSLGTYRNWEQGAGRLKGDIICAIADKYDCSVDYLLCRVDDPTPYPKPGESREAFRDLGERKLVDSYRKMDAADRDKLIGVAETFVVASEKDGEGDGEDVVGVGVGVGVGAGFALTGAGESLDISTSKKWGGQ